MHAFGEEEEEGGPEGDGGRGVCACVCVFKVCPSKGLKTLEKFLGDTSPRPSNPAGRTLLSLPLRCLGRGRGGSPGARRCPGQPRRSGAAGPGPARPGGVSVCVSLLRVAALFRSRFCCAV